MKTTNNKKQIFLKTILIKNLSKKIAVIAKFDNNKKLKNVLILKIAY